MSIYLDNELNLKYITKKNSIILQIESTKFSILQGPVSFRNRQRRAETIISQFQINLNQQKIRTIAEYSHISGFNINCSKCQSLIWPGKNKIIEYKKKKTRNILFINPDVIPVDTERNVVRRVVLNVAEIILITIACLLGLALAIFFLTFNIIYRHER